MDSKSNMKWGQSSRKKVDRKLPQVHLLPGLERLLHPHLVPQSRVVGVKIAGEEAGIVQKAVLDQQGQGRCAVVPGR